MRKLRNAWWLLAWRLSDAYWRCYDVCYSSHRIARYFTTPGCPEDLMRQKMLASQTYEVGWRPVSSWQPIMRRYRHERLTGGLLALALVLVGKIAQLWLHPDLGRMLITLGMGKLLIDGIVFVIVQERSSLIKDRECPPDDRSSCSHSSS